MQYWRYSKHWLCDQVYTQFKGYPCKYNKLKTMDRTVWTLTLKMIVQSYVTQLSKIKENFYIEVSWLALTQNAGYKVTPVKINNNIFLATWHFPTGDCSDYQRYLHTSPQVISFRNQNKSDTDIITTLTTKCITTRRHYDSAILDDSGWSVSFLQAIIWESCWYF